MNSSFRNTLILIIALSALATFLVLLRFSILSW